MVARESEKKMSRNSGKEAALITKCYGSDRFQLQQQHRYKRNEESDRFSREKSESRGKNREVWRRKKTSRRQAV